MARCKNIQKRGVLESVVVNAAKLMSAENSVFSGTQESLLALADQNDFRQLTYTELQHQDEITKVLVSYLQGKTNYSGKIALYANGLNSAEIKPEWFDNQKTSKRLWSSFQMKPEESNKNIYLFAPLEVGVVREQFVPFEQTTLYVDFNKPPQVNEIKKWFRGNPDNAKVLLKATILADPKLTNEAKKEIDLNIKVLEPILIPLR